MDVTQYADYDRKAMRSDYKLRKHCKAIRENQVSVAVMMLALHGYSVELNRAGKPLASFARECLNEIETEGQIGVWSCSTKAGGIWTTEQRKMLKSGEA